MRRALPLALLLALAAGCESGTAARFSISGVITPAPQLQKLTDNRPNAVLFIIASNAAGIPVAIRRVVHPKLPLAYTLTEEDLLLPGPVYPGPLTLKVQITNHGQVGILAHGDLTGSHRGLVHSGDGGVDVVIDRKI